MCITNDILNSMRNVIENFPKQLLYQPVVENANALKKAKKFVVLGMGGSHLAADLVKMWKPELDITVHSDYGLPAQAGLPLQAGAGNEDTLVIAFSYSGNTEEPLDGFETARAAGFPVAVIASGGKLLEAAKISGVPHVELSDRSIEPRHALGYSTRALLALLGEDDALAETVSLAVDFNPKEYEVEGKTLADTLVNKIPVVYASRTNAPLAYNWKIKFNETSKVPAFYNLFPELNHNEMNGFEENPKTKNLRDKFSFIFLRDSHDYPRIQRRMDVLRVMYEERGITVTEVDISDSNPWKKIFAALILGDWVTYLLALHYGHDPEAVPMVEEFKKRIA